MFLSDPILMVLYNRSKSSERVRFSQKAIFVLCVPYRYDSCSNLTTGSLIGFSIIRYRLYFFQSSSNMSSREIMGAERPSWFLSSMPVQMAIFSLSGKELYQSDSVVSVPSEM